jgi:hypothetical protein
VVGEERENDATSDAVRLKTAQTDEDASSVCRAEVPQVQSLSTRPTMQVAVEEAPCEDTQLVLDSFTLDEATLVNSPLLPYLAMIAGLIEGRVIGCHELLGVLRRSMRQRSLDRLPRREYLLRFLDRHPP